MKPTNHHNITERLHPLPEGEGRVRVPWFVSAMVRVSRTIFLLMLLLTACRTVRTDKASQNIATTATNDSNAVKRTEAKSYTTEDWERIIERFAKPVNVAGDTNIYISNYPVERIIERGSKQQATQTNTVDSTARSAIMQLVATLEQRSRQADAPITIWHLIGLGAGIIVINFLVNNIKISRK